MVFGSGRESERIDGLPISVFITNWFPLIFLTLLMLVGFVKNLRTNQISKAKSYVLIGLISLIIYPFRLPILDFFINLFQ
ncbi:hypothetical protein C3K47_19305 [Solitalea longa]|uniref:Uncharacterized protein n=1 Tax=Solitalea longa TaxID=2079460 RepID=A0A2S4ZXB9_9SPHI|nr:hypothetical protein C3K47_19305 [Solitalea longa]